MTNKTLHTPHHSFLILLLAILLIGCARSTPPAPMRTQVTSTMAPAVIPVTPTGSPTPALPSPTATTTRTLPPATLTLMPEAAPLTYQRPTFDYADPIQLQIIAQWSTGPVESHYTWSPDGSKLLLVSAPVTRLIDVQTFQQLWEAPGGTEGAFSEDGQWVRIQNGGAGQVYHIADGRPGQSGKPFQPEAPVQMTQPVKSFTRNYDPGTAHPFNRLLMAVQEDWNHRELRFFYPRDGCPRTIYKNLPSGITGYSFSPDNRLILITAQGIGAKPDYKAVILGLNSGFEAQLPSNLQDPSQPGFHPTRPGLGIVQQLPILYTPLNGQSLYPPTISQPDDPVETYRLKPWNDAAGMAMLDSLVQYATANDVFGPASGRSSFFQAQEPLRMATLEYLLRFPQSTNRTAVLWRLAMTNSILSRKETDAWIATQLDQALNRQGLALEPLSLNAALAPFGFYVDASPFPPGKTPHNFMQYAQCNPNFLPPNPLIVDNLFGDSLTSQILIIKTIGANTGMVVAVHPAGGGKAQVIPVVSQWALYDGMLQEIEGIDITGDGRPEIRLDAGWHNGSMNGNLTGFYQWQGIGPREGKFVEITGGIENPDYSFPPVKITGGPVGPKTIDYHKFYVGLVTLKWDGQRFVKETHISFPLAAESIEDQYVYLAAIRNGQHTEVINQIRSLPPDPWRTFLLGYVEALRFHPGHARAALQPLAEQAQTDPSNELAKAASAFLAVYQNETDLYRACRAAHQVNQNAPCGTDLALQSLLDHLSSQPVNDLPGVLEGLGVTLYYHAQLDFNGDVRDDWLLAKEYAYGDILLPFHASKMWLVISKLDGFEAQPFEDIAPSSTIPLALTSIQLKIGINEKPVQVFLLKAQAGGRAGGRFFRVRQKGEQWVIDHLLEDWNMSEYQIVEGGSALLIFHNTENFYPPEIAHWDTLTGKFKKSDYLEYLLLREGSTDEALQLIPSLLEYVEQHPGEEGYTLALYGSRLQYLFGLAYELSGDAENATRVYYNLWKSHPIQTLDPHYLGHPDQPYAIMAREKLEQVNK